MSNKLNEKSPNIILRKANWWTLDVLIGLFWSIYGSLKPLKVRNIQAEVSGSVFCRPFHLEPQNVVW